jgi:hypothetical protein
MDREKANKLMRGWAHLTEQQWSVLVGVRNKTSFSLLDADAVHQVVESGCGCVLIALFEGRKEALDLLFRIAGTKDPSDRAFMRPPISLRRYMKEVIRGRTVEVEPMTANVPPKTGELRTWQGYLCAACGVSEIEKELVFSRCSKCKDARYCSPECQKKDWKERHRRICGRTQVCVDEFDLSAGGAIRVPWAGLA